MERTNLRKSVKQKPPVIRQTLTSIYRIAKANPLLFIENAPRVTDTPSSINLNKVKVPNFVKPAVNTQTGKTKLVQPPVSTKNVENNNKVNKPASTTKQLKLPRGTIQTKALPPASQVKINLTTSTPQLSKQKVKQRRSLSADHYERTKTAPRLNSNIQSLTNLNNEVGNTKQLKPPRGMTQTKPFRPVSQVKPSQIKSTPQLYKQKMKPRRSLSADHYERTKTAPRLNSNIQSVTNLDNEVGRVKQLKPPHGVTQTKPHPPVSQVKPSQIKSTPQLYKQKMKPRRSSSADHYERTKTAPRLNSNIQSVTNLDNVHNEVDNINHISPIVERRVKFQIPLKMELSGPVTPSPFVSKHSTPYVIRTNYQHSDLHNQLKLWLQQRKKTLNVYSMLQKFGASSRHLMYEEENKENEEVSVNRENFEIEMTPTSKGINEDLPNMVRGALKDLHKLISEGYCVDQSEDWLNVIREKFCYLEDEPLYWECRAAIEQGRGEFIIAVNCLHTAVVQGAEVASIDLSLEELLRKFKLLNLGTSDGKLNGDQKQDRVKMVKDAHDVFKSSIIQFAVQERDMKKKTIQSGIDKKFAVTPVRRSTRLTPSRYRSTSRVRICSSLQDMDDAVLSNMDFTANRDLNIRFLNV
ncbi:hypothetical protein FQA39_LY06538 [Lamprigera yunnana]|nr:hypothetical protein FQA39_LY06538 [Lamprigera yunnana]